MRALLRLLEIRRDSALGQWRGAKTHVDLVEHQTRYNEAQATIDLITKAPIIKSV